MTYIYDGKIRQHKLHTPIPPRRIDTRSVTNIVEEGAGDEHEHRGDHGRGYQSGDDKERE